MSKFMKELLLISLVLLLFTSCNDDSNNFGFNTKISECGGFKIDNLLDKFICKNKPSKIIKLDDEEKCKDYLKWEYNKDTKVLSLLHLNASLNCCGVHSLSVSDNENNSYTITEKDEPEGAGRCDCMCTYSFYTELQNIEKEIIKVNLKQNIEENSEISTILETTSIDLTQAEKGEVFIKEFYSMGSCNK